MLFCIRVIITIKPLALSNFSKPATSMFCLIVELSTSQPIYNTVHDNTVLDITRIGAGPQNVIINLFSYTSTFYSHYKTVWIANTEIGLDPNNSVIRGCGVYGKLVRSCWDGLSVVLTTLFLDKLTLMYMVNW